MSKAEKFLQENTKNCSNALIYDEREIVGYESWLTPDQAREAVKIAKEELIEKVCEYLEPKIWAINMGDQKITDECIEDFKKAMKDE